MNRVLAEQEARLEKKKSGDLPRRENKKNAPPPAPPTGFAHSFFAK